MKVLIVSDLHANIDALNAIWEQENDADAVLCAGDVVDWGFYPHETIAWLQERQAVVVLGNHDLAFIQRYDSGVREPLGKETTYMSHCLNHTTEDDVNWLRALPEVAVVEYDGITYCLKHSIVMRESKSSVQQYLGELRSISAFRELWMQLVGSDDQKKKRIVIGHSHICYMLRAFADEMYINPGSTHYRKGPDSIEKGADYITVTDGIAVMKHVDYPTAHLRKKILNSNFPPEIQRPALRYAESEVD